MENARLTDKISYGTPDEVKKIKEKYESGVKSKIEKCKIDDDRLEELINPTKKGEILDRLQHLFQAFLFGTLIYGSHRDGRGNVVPELMPSGVGFTVEPQVGARIPLPWWLDVSIWDCF